MVARDGARHQLSLVPDADQFRGMLVAANGSSELRDLRNVTDAVSRIMLADVVVGDSRLPGEQRIATTGLSVLTSLKGDVFVLHCLDLAKWLPQLRRLRDARCGADPVGNGCGDCRSPGPNGSNC